MRIMSVLFACFLVTVSVATTAVGSDADKLRAGLAQHVRLLKKHVQLWAKRQRRHEQPKQDLGAMFRVLDQNEDKDQAAVLEVLEEIALRSTRDMRDLTELLQRRNLEAELHVQEALSTLESLIKATLTEVAHLNGAREQVDAATQAVLNNTASRGGSAATPVESDVHHEHPGAHDTDADHEESARANPRDAGPRRASKVYRWLLCAHVTASLIIAALMIHAWWLRRRLPSQKQHAH